MDECEGSFKGKEDSYLWKLKSRNGEAKFLRAIKFEEFNTEKVWLDVLIVSIRRNGTDKEDEKCE